MLRITVSGTVDDKNEDLKDIDFENVSSDRVGYLLWEFGTNLSVEIEEI